MGGGFCFAYISTEAFSLKHFFPSHQFKKMISIQEKIQVFHTFIVYQTVTNYSKFAYYYKIYLWFIISKKLNVYLKYSSSQ